MTEEEIFRRYGEPLTIPIAGDLEVVLASSAKMLPSELAALDKKVREVSPYSSVYQSWPQISAEELERILRSPLQPVPLIGLISFHRSGYIRELAVRRLAEATSGRSLPFLLLRLNDWVEPVAQTALKAVQARMTSDYADALIRNIPLVLDLGRRSRRSHSPLISTIMALLGQPECSAALQRGLTSPDRLVRHCCFRILIEANDERLPESVPKMLMDADPAIRQAAARAARTSLSTRMLQALLPQMTRDTSVAVRREALSAFVERLPELAPTALREALLDRHASLREAARYRLKLRESVDLAEFYRQALASSLSPVKLEAAISGLGETSTAADVGLVLSYLSHPLARVRRMAVRAVSRLDGDGQTSVLLAALTDRRPSVVHEAREAFRPRLNLLDKNALWQIFRNSFPVHVRQDVLRLFRALPKWEAMPFLVRAAVDEDPVIREQAAKYLQDWLESFNRSFTKPNAIQLTRMEEALQANPDATLKQLLSDLKKRGML